MCSIACQDLKVSLAIISLFLFRKIILFRNICVTFAEIHSINEHCDYFTNMIHDIGLQLRSTAICTGIRRLRYGHFDTSHALLRQHWNLEDIIDNMRQNSKLLKPQYLAGEGNVQMVDSTETQDKRQIEG